MENFGRTRKANLPFDSTLKNFSLNRLQTNGSVSGYDLNPSNVNTFSRNVHNENRREKSRNLIRNNESYAFKADTQTVETKRTKVYNKPPQLIDDDIERNYSDKSNQQEELKTIQTQPVVSEKPLKPRTENLNVEQSRITQTK